MTNRQINTYFSRLLPKDPNKDFFINTIIPSLKGIPTDTSTKYNCPVCNEKKHVKSSLSSQLELKTNNNSKDNNTFTNYYTYIRHLSEKHSNILPCNGNIFFSDGTKRISEFNISNRIFHCYVCELSFNRKEHLKKHFESKKHKENEKQKNYEDDSVVSKSKLNSPNMINDDEVIIDQMNTQFFDSNQKRKRNHEDEIYSDESSCSVRLKKVKSSIETAASNNNEDFIIESFFFVDDIPCAQRPVDTRISDEEETNDEIFDYILLPIEENSNESSVKEIIADTSISTQNIEKNESKQNMLKEIINEDLEISDNELIECLLEYEKKIIC